MQGKAKQYFLKYISCISLILVTVFPKGGRKGRKVEMPIGNFEGLRPWEGRHTEGGEKSIFLKYINCISLTLLSTYLRGKKGEESGNANLRPEEGRHAD